MSLIGLGVWQKETEMACLCTRGAVSISKLASPPGGDLRRLLGRGLWQCLLPLPPA